MNNKNSNGAESPGFSSVLDGWDVVLSAFRGAFGLRREYCRR